MDKTETITKEKLAMEIQAKLGFSRPICLEIVELFFASIVNQATLSKKVTIRKFGKFEVKDKKSRPGLNMQSGKAVTISARKVIRFIPSKKFKTELQNEQEILSYF